MTILVRLKENFARSPIGAVKKNNSIDIFVALNSFLSVYSCIILGNGLCLVIFLHKKGVKNEKKILALAIAGSLAVPKRL